MEAAAKREAERHLQSMTTISVSLVTERFRLGDKKAVKGPVHHEQQSNHIPPAQKGGEEPEATVQGSE